MSTMIGIWRDVLYWLGIAAQLIRHNDTWLTVLPDQSGEKTLGSLGVTARLNQNLNDYRLTPVGFSAWFWIY